MAMKLFARPREQARILGQARDMLRGQEAAIALFVVLSILLAAAEVASVGMVIPVLETVAGGRSFANTPVIGWATSGFESLTPKDWLRWAAGLLAVFLLLRGGLQYVVSVMAMTVPTRITRSLCQRAYDTLLASGLRHLWTLEAGERYNYAVLYPERSAKVIKSLAQFFVSTVPQGNPPATQQAP